MKLMKHFHICVVLIALVAALAFPTAGFAVDPDMQALVIDNGSGMCSDEPGHCDAEWTKLWNKLDRADRNLTRTVNIKPAKLSALCDRTWIILADLALAVAQAENCCEGTNDEFREQYQFLITEFSGACN